MSEKNTAESATRPQTSDVSSSRPDPPDGYKRIRHPGTGHAIQGPWNDPQSSLQRQIIEALGDMKWIAINIFRIGYAESYEALEDESLCPATISVAVKVGSKTAEQGQAAVLRCKKVLEEFDFSDVEVEIYEARMWGAFCD
ncbi:hypothetical protein LB505_014331 [Fusarium chuoi]|nr:hypothetical protein LB505_014331 [Fusarium chuoi]